ncbi:hypothetical protein SLE2022_184080 [Rubroshorea leprosula]
MWGNNVRLISVLLGAANLLVAALGAVLLFVAYSSSCNRRRRRRILPLLLTSIFATLRILTIFKIANAQEAITKSILDSPATTDAVDIVVRRDRRIKYKRWLWWTRFAIVVTLLQFVAATYLIFMVAKFVSRDETSNQCVLGLAPSSDGWKQKTMALFMILTCFVALVQCFTGSDVLTWRSFYKSQDNAWKAHYHEVFDHGIREALCCLGRYEYLSVLEEDEVHSVARLLGELVTYRATGTGHLELLTGLALLQKHNQSPKSYEGFVEAPIKHLQAAITLHKFAEAAYTGPLLDLGRNLFLFPCTWLYRQGIFTPWTRNRRPILTGDNWWRGHAAAFLKFINLSPEVLRRGRVCQKRCEAAYFIVVLHHIRSVVIAVRGTETPEDLITDGLGKESPLSFKDLDGIINSNHINPEIRHHVESSFPHYGHSGVIEAARDLYEQVEGNSEHDSESIGFLSSLLGAGCECEGYDVCIVGHSLGGAIAALLGLRLYSKLPNLHVYSFGPLPCVDSVVADACSQFVTSIIHDNEFSARLSVGSIMRLRADLITAISEDTKTDRTLIFKLAQRFFYVSQTQPTQTTNLRIENSAERHFESSINEDLGHDSHRGGRERDQEFSLWNRIGSRENDIKIDDDDCTNPFASHHANQKDDPVSQFMDIVPNCENQPISDPHEMFLPGLVIHLVPEKRNFGMLSWQGKQSYKAFIVDRECFKDMVVSTSMFLDHLPWRCHQAMKKVLEARNSEALDDVSQMA